MPCGSSVKRWLLREQPEAGRIKLTWWIQGVRKCEVWLNNVKYPKVLSNPKSAVVWEKQFSLKQLKFRRSAGLQVYIYIIIYRYLRDTNDNYDTYEILWYIMIPFSDLSRSFPWDDPHVVTYDTDRRRVGSSSAASRPFGKPVTCALVGAGEKRMGDVLAPFLGQAILRVENIYHLVI